SAPAGATAGGAFVVTVIAQDGGGHTDTGYSGVIRIGTSGGSPVLPNAASLVNGVGSFPVTLTTVGTFTVTPHDMANATISGQSGTVAVSAGAASYFTVAAPPAATTGTPISVTIAAIDRYGNMATGYAGKVHFVTLGGGASLPADTGLQNGQGTFSVIFKTA